MQYSYNWLKKYVSNLPPADELEQGIIFHAFEVESLEKKNNDILLDIKILPDRAHDCLSHLGIAREAAAIFNLSCQKPNLKSVSVVNLDQLSIKISDPKLCRRYIGRRVNGIKIAPSPKWLVSALESVGQRSINNVVDATNYVLFDLGQPLHAFDADKVSGDINVRPAKKGEKIITLDNREIILDESILVIADDLGPLAIAGIKGGNRAEVDDKTTNLILEAANFDPVIIRKTRTKIGLATDASKRFENELSAELAVEAMSELSSLLSELAGGQYGEVVDVYPIRIEPREISLEIDKINKKLGLNLSAEMIVNILQRLEIIAVENKGEIRAKIPHWRVDLTEGVNLIEEIGRLFGYEKVEAKVFETTPADIHRIDRDDQQFLALNHLRQILVEAGFSELMGYALVNRGEVELTNPLASDKGWLRDNLTDWLADRLIFNLNYVLFDQKAVKVFEIGRVFQVDLSERIVLALGIAYRKKPKDVNLETELKIILEKMSTIGLITDDYQTMEMTGGLILSLDLTEKIDQIKPVTGELMKPWLVPAFAYKKVSSYPRIIRDIAVWVPKNKTVEEIQITIKNQAGEFCVEGPILFDEFVKDEKKSLAFRLVFQSMEKTLSDEEINLVMDRITEQMKINGWEVR